MSQPQIATAQPLAGRVAPHLEAPTARSPEHAAALASWSRVEGLVRAGREACERGERVRELRNLGAARDALLELAGWPL